MGAHSLVPGGERYKLGKKTKNTVQNVLWKKINFSGERYQEKNITSLKTDYKCKWNLPVYGCKTTLCRLKCKWELIFIDNLEHK